MLITANFKLILKKDRNSFITDPTKFSLTCFAFEHSHMSVNLVVYVVLRASNDEIRSAKNKAKSTLNITLNFRFNPIVFLFLAAS